MFTLVCCNFSKSQGGKIQILLELSYHSHLKKEGMTAAIVDHRRRGGRSKPYSTQNKAKGIFEKMISISFFEICPPVGSQWPRENHGPMWAEAKSE